MITEDYLDELAEKCVDSTDQISVRMDDGDYCQDCVTWEDAKEIYKDGFREALRQIQSEYTSNKHKPNNNEHSV